MLLPEAACGPLSCKMLCVPSWQLVQHPGQTEPGSKVGKGSLKSRDRKSAEVGDRTEPQRFSY